MPWELDKVAATFGFAWMLVNWLPVLLTASTVGIIPALWKEQKWDKDYMPYAVLGGLMVLQGLAQILIPDGFQGLFLLELALKGACFEGSR